MNTKLLTAAALLAAFAAIAFWPAPTHVADGSPATAPPPSAPAVAAADPAPNDGPSAAPEREAVTAPPRTAPTATDEPFDPTPVRVAPWLAEVLVVDEHDRPVPDAVVTVWELHKVEAPEFVRRERKQRHAYSGRETPARATARTDLSGRARIQLDGEAYEADADKDAVGHSAAVRLWHGKRVGEAHVLRLQPRLFASGQVLAADATPLADAEVTVTGSASTQAESPWADEIPPQRTDADGRFRVPVQRWVVYTFVARWQDAQSFAFQTFVRSDAPPPILLTMPGAFTIAGTVVAADDTPVAAAEVTAWQELPAAPRADGSRLEPLTTHTDAGGAFTLAVRAPVPHRVLAAAKDHATSDLVAAEPTTVRPHAQARIVLPAFATIRGRLQKPDGAPLPGFRVFAQPENGSEGFRDPVPKQAEPNDADRFPRVAAVTTDADGAFALRVHPGTRWTVTARLVPANWRIAVHAHDVAAGTDDLLMTASDEDCAGCMLRGVVTSDVAVAGGIRLKIVDCEADGQPTGASEFPATWSGDRFEAQEPLPHRAWFRLRAAPSDRGTDVAGDEFGPFRAEAATLDITLHLARYGKLPVRVLDGDGMPILHARVGAQSQHRWLDRDPTTLDEHGTATLTVPPGPATLRTWVDGALVDERNVTIASGDNAEIVVRLAR